MNKERLKDLNPETVNAALLHWDISEEIYESSEATMKAIEHHGIKGQVHGIRNGPPYPLTNEQRTSKERKSNPVSEAIKNYKKKAAQKVEILKKQKAKEKEEKKAKAAEEKAKKKEQAEKDKAEAAKKLDYKHMTNEELQGYINRARLEQQYRDLVLPKKKDNYVKELVTNGLKTMAQKTINDVVIPKVIDAAKEAAGLKKEKTETNSFDIYTKNNKDLNKLSDKEIESLANRAGKMRSIESYYGGSTKKEKTKGTDNNGEGKKKNKSKKETTVSKETAVEEGASIANDIGSVVSDIVNELKESRKDSWYSA